MSETATGRAIAHCAQMLITDNQRIDGVFADAGRRLGTGIELFARLTANLNQLAGEFSAGDIADAHASLGKTSQKLRELAEALPGETQHLEAISDSCGVALSGLKDLREQMLLVTILARSARIEAASTEAGESDFGEFTNEIVDLTARAFQVVEKCVRDHGDLTALLESAVTRQRDFGSRYAHALPLLIQRLEQSRTMLGGRQERSLASTRATATRAGTISAAVGNAIIALQSGDSVRQRIEHVVAALETAASVIDGEGRGAELCDGMRRPVAELIVELAGRQLQGAAETLGDEIHQIGRSLDVLGPEINAIAGGCLSLNDADDAAQGSFLDRLERELREAADMVRQCDQARNDLARLTGELDETLDLFQANIATLSDTVADIVVVGLNAGLRAARLGIGGRGLVVIAEDLKSTADRIAISAGRVIVMFEAVQSASQASLGYAAANPVDVSKVYRAMKEALAGIQRSGASLAGTFKQVASEARGFGGVIAGTRQIFANMATVADDMVLASADLHAMLSGAGNGWPRDSDAAREIFQGIWDKYTMATEREIHRALIEAPLPDDASASGLMEIA